MLKRPRRLRSCETIRNLIRETTLKVEDLIYPIFVVEGENIKNPISSLPGIFHFSVDRLKEELDELVKLNIHAVLLFGIPNHKDECASSAFDENGIVQKAVKYIKENYPKIYVITDICMCQYTNHGHCGILDSDGYVNNDKTLEYLGKIAISHAKAGADMVAPSDMMDGRIGHMRKALDENHFERVAIMAYSAKYASSYYGPFREAADSAPSFGDRKTYQMDPANSKEAIREIKYDIEEGADIVMVKPALSYLDVIKEASLTFDMPIAAYSVSGEYSMLKTAVANGLMKEDVILETMTSIKRAGANLIITYFAKDLAAELKYL